MSSSIRKPTTRGARKSPAGPLALASALVALSMMVSMTALSSCAAPSRSSALPSWSFEPGMVFPADLSLSRAEDGVALPEGRLVVADQVHGLRLVEPDGRSRPFGDLPGAGYANDPPRRNGAPNGVSLEPDGRHLLVADVIGGEIYRVELASGATRLLYSHPHGVNTAVRDSTGAIWFSQSARNTEEQGELGLFTPVDIPVAEGALWRLPCEDGRLATEAVRVVDGLRYANGLAIDEGRGVLYLCELAANRVLEFPLDVRTGRLGTGTTLLEIPTPDNVELDSAGRLWVVSPVCSQVFVVDPDTRASHSVFHAQSAQQVELSREWARRGSSSSPRLELLTPALFEPLPGFLTGVILGAPDGTVYLTGLGNALIRMERSTPMSSKQLEEMATRYAAAWSSQDPERLAVFYAENGALVVNEKPPATGRAAIAAKAREFMEAFPDMLVVMDSVQREGDRVLFRWTWTGTNTGPEGTGRSVRLSGHEEWTLDRDGRIAESRGHYDETEYERQVSGAPGAR